MYLLFSYFRENSGTCLGRLRKIMRNFRQDSQPIHFTATLYTFTWSCPLNLLMHVLYINLSRQIYLCLTYMFPSTTTQFTSLVTTSYMFQTYWPPSGIKYMIWKLKKWLYTKKMQIQILKINFTYKHKVLESRPQTK